MKSSFKLNFANDLTSIIYPHSENVLEVLNDAFTDITKKSKIAFIVQIMPANDLTAIIDILGNELFMDNCLNFSLPPDKVFIFLAGAFSRPGTTNDFAFIVYAAKKIHGHRQDLKVAFVPKKDPEESLLVYKFSDDLVLVVDMKLQDRPESARWSDRFILTVDPKKS